MYIAKPFNFSGTGYSETLEFISLLKPNLTELNISSQNPKFFNISFFSVVRFNRTELCISLGCSVQKKYRNIEVGIRFENSRTSL